MTTCAEGCGQCCDPVTLPYTRAEMLTIPGIPESDRQWAVRSLRPMGAKEAYRLAPWLRGKKHRDAVTGELADGFFFRCVHFDRETRACTDYDNRPAMCRNYPWYTGKPHPAAALPPSCSFRADIGEVPVRVTRKPG